MGKGLLKIILPLFLLLLISCGSNENYAAAEQGFLDLSDRDFSEESVILGGTWLYYPHEFTGGSFPDYPAPDEFNTLQSRKDNGQDPQGWGSYVLRLRLPEHNPELRISIRESQAAYRILVNGVNLGGSGQLGKEREFSRPGKKIIPLPFQTGVQDIVLTILYSNFDHREGPFPLPTLGSSINIASMNQWKLYRDIFFTGSFASVSLLYFILFMGRRRDRYTLWFSLICLLTGLRVLLTDSALIDRITPDSWVPFLLKTEYIGLILLVISFFLFIRNMFSQYLGKKLTVITLAPSLIYLPLVLVTPMIVYTSLLPVYQAVIIATGAATLYGTLRARIKSTPWSGSILVLILAMLLSSILDILYFNHRISFGPVTVYVTFLAILTQGYSLMRRYSGNLVNLEKITSEYRKANIALQSNQKKIEEQNKRLNQLAFIDQLTQLPNRISMLEILGNKMALARREGNLLGMFYIDVDHFKRMNDTLGQGMGDTILYNIAQRLKLSLRKSDNLFRISGDEFLVLAEDLKEESQIKVVAEKIQRAFLLPLDVGGKEFFITVSIGISHWSREHTGDSITALVRKADVAVSKAKELGRNCFVFYTPEMDQELTFKVRIEEKMRQALLMGHFHLFYQAQIDMEEGELHGFEALIRWIDPEEGMIPPDQFIPFAESSGMIIEIGKWVIDESCRQLRKWLDQGYRDFTLSVNLSVRQFEREDLIPYISGVISRWDIPPEYMVLELTESALMTDVKQITEKMEELRALGLKLAIDDFGTGYSNLGYLSAFPLNILKIDKMFIANIQNNEKDRKLVYAIINIAQSLELDIVAEGVEEQEVLELLHSRGCRFIQGYIYSRPAPASEAESFFSYSLKKK